MINTILSFKIKKDYANHLLELLLKDEAIETINDEENVELTKQQKNELDKELVLRKTNPEHYKNWNEVKEQLHSKV